MDLHFPDIAVIEARRKDGAELGDMAAVPNSVLIDGKKVAVSADHPFTVDRVSTQVHNAVYVTCTFIARSFYAGPEEDAPTPWSAHSPEPIDTDPALPSRHDAGWVEPPP